MKKIVVVLLCVLLGFSAGAQSIFDELVEKYVDVEGFSAVQLTNDMFELYMKKKNIDADDPVYDVLNDLDNMMVVSQTFTSDNDKLREEMKTEIRSYYQDNDYLLFKTEKNASSDLKIYIDRTDDGIKSMGLLSSNSFSVNLIEMNGAIDLSKVASLYRVLNIRGLEQLQVFDNTKSPNNFYFNYQFEMPDLSNYEISDERRREIEENVRISQEEMRKYQDETRKNQLEMSKRQQQLFEKYNKFPIIIKGAESKNAEYFVDDEKVDKDQILELDPERIESIRVIRKDDGKDNQAQIKITVKKDK